jgi:hypothetical protein
MIGRPLLLTAPAALWIALFTLAPFVLVVAAAVLFWTFYALQLLKTLR